MWDHRLDRQQQEGFIITDMGLIYQHGVCPAAHVQKKILESPRQGVVVQDLCGDSVVWLARVEWPGVVQPIRQLDDRVAGECRVDDGVVDEVQALLLLVPERFAQHLSAPKPLGWDLDHVAAAFVTPEVPQHAHQDADDHVEHHHHIERPRFPAGRRHVASPLQLDTGQEIFNNH